MSKIPKVVAGYLPQQFVPPEGTHCGACRDFIRLTNECVIISPAPVSPDRGTCILFVKGRPHETGRAQHLIPARTAGYIEGREVPTYCGRCVHYNKPDFPLSTCATVGDFEDDKVEYGGCCNGYEARRV